MAVTLKTAGTWAESTTAAQTVTIPGSPAAGDRMFLFRCWKDFALTANTLTGWNLISEHADGTTAQGNGTGSMKVACWYRDWQSGDSNPAPTLSGAPNISAAVIQLWQKGATESWNTPTFVTGPMTWTNSSTYDSASSTLAVPDGAAVIHCVGCRDDSGTFTRPTDGVRGSGITWNGNVVEPQAHISTTTANDLSADVVYRLVTTGATATLEAGATLSATETGEHLWVSQSVTPFPTISSVAPYLFDDADTGIVVTGTSYLTSQGAGKVELGSSSVYASATKVNQTITAWTTGTSITFTAVKGALSYGAVWVFVTNNLGGVSDGFQVTLTAPADFPITDAFTDTNDVLLENHVPGAGTMWSNRAVGSSTAKINTNRVVAANVTGGAEYENWATPASAEYELSADMNLGAVTGPEEYAFMELFGRRTPGVSEYNVQLYTDDLGTGTTVELYKLSGGLTLLDDFTDPALQLGTYDVVFTLTDAEKTVTITSPVVVNLSSADNDLTSAGVCGVYLGPPESNSNWLDNFSAEDIVAPSVNITGEAATATAAALFDTVTAVRIVSVVGEVSSATSTALAGTVQIARSVTGELATADATALDGTVTAIRSVSIVGEAASATAAALDGTITSVRITSVTGELASATADGLAGSVQIARSVSGELASADAAALAGAVQISASVSGALATATADAFEGTIDTDASVNASVTGETATAAADGLAGTITTVRIVSIAGEASQATANALDGTITSVRITSITAETAPATADALAGSVQITRSITGETATADAAALAGSVLISASIVGVAAEATAEALAGTVTVVRTVSISGEVSTATATALEGTITAVRILSVFGESATATAETLDGTVTTIRAASIVGEPASATAAGLAGSIQIARSVAGELAQADAEGLAGSITTVRIVSISGEPATSDAVALEGIISTLPSANIEGQAATASASALEATITSVRIVSITGEPAAATANALEGTVSTGAAVSATVNGELATASADAQAALISALVSASISGEAATANSAALVPIITTVRFSSISGELALAAAVALLGSIIIEEAAEVTPIVSGLVELEDLIDRQIWPDNVDPTGVIFPRSPVVPSGYIETIEEENPSGFQKQSGRTELWNL